MPRATVAAAAQTAETLLISATALFAARGFADVSVDDIAQASGVTRGAVYHHFQSKADLFAAVASRLQVSLADAVVAAAKQAGSDPGSQLRAGSHAFLDAITDKSVLRILLIDAPSVVGWQEWRRLDAQNSAVHLREALGNVGVPGDLLDATTAQLSGAMNESALWIAEHPNTPMARKQSHLALDQLLESFIL